ncbi:DUF421 domain-containing protein [Hazenella sp. IB182357]|uniref:DUF421 domain-containing protein n=1 Tax=Polycladospora coralii TaxID=2771432 RepID=A0A926N7X1_9BACL|nr:DUF421 domain-containing protein [Polycladospora coralii]MBD1371721.1 DUF421 domain-containing protein [Polycladospora coralii]MBS7529188.1 DUF421 domain-containing protein [Polycladospora coralii]
MLWTIFLRTVFIYFFIIVVMRVMGKREIGKLSIFDLIVYFLIADMSAMVIEKADEGLMHAIVPIATLAGLQLVIAYLSLKSERIRQIVDGEPVYLIKHGELQEKEMSKARYNLEDLMTQLREKSIPDVRDVEFAILETSGKLSVFKKEEKNFIEKEDVPLNHPLVPFNMPTILILDGKVREDGLRLIGKTIFWLKNQIQTQGYKDFKEILYASIDHKGELFVDAKGKNEED